MNVRLGRAIAAIAVTVGLLSMPIQLIFGNLPFELRPDLGTAAGAFAVAAVGFGAVAWLTLPTQRENRLVWLLTVSASFAAIAAFGTILVSLSWPAELTSEDGIRAVSPAQLPTVGAMGVLIINAAWVPGLLLVVTVGLLLFPDGHSAEGWDWLAMFNGLVVGLLVVFNGLASHPNSTEPIARSLLEYFDGGPLALIAGVLYLPLLVGGGLAVVVLAKSYRASTGTRRHQIQWIAFGGAALLAGGLLRGFDVVGPALAGMVVFIASFYVAITKYRLYDIDVIISKSVMYLGLLAAITAVYAAVVVVPLLVIGAGDGDGPGLLLPIVATAVVAVLFEPIRSRMQRWANRLVYGNRSTPHEVLSQVTARLAESTGASTDELARLVAMGTGAEQAVVSIVTDSGTIPTGRWSVSSPSTAALTESGDLTAVVDVLHEGERLGTVSITKPPNDPITPADRELLDDVAASAGLLLRNIRLNKELEDRAADVRESRRRLIEAQDRERHRLERDLHDGAQQQVVALKVKLGIAKTVAQRENAPDIADHLIGLADISQVAVDALRHVAHGIYPPLLESEGLEPALRAVGRTSALPIELNAVDIDRYPRSTEETAYFCVTETLERARMSGARSASVEVAGRNGDLITSIDLGSLDTELDLRAVADRLDAAGGSMMIEDQPERGRCVVSSLPVAPFEGETS